LEEIEEGRPLLEVKGLTKSFGGLAALQDFDLQVAKMEIVGLIGPNGAGKTTLFNIIAGNIRQDQGEVYFEVRNFNQLKPFERCRLGIARTYQTVRPFLDFSVEQNVIIGLRYGRGKNTLSSSNLYRKGEEILDLLGLEVKRHELTKNLTLVDRKLVEVARALATNPKLLLLDEVLSGLNPVELEKAVKMIKNISVSLGITIIWIEHIMQALLAICDRFVVLNYGIKLIEGKPTQVLSDERVIEAYLGKVGKKLAKKNGHPYSPISGDI
jgi:branched-chain amino acid transport system ATP-binding protein